MYLDDLKEFLHGEAKTAEEFLVRQDQIDRQGCINLIVVRLRGKYAFHFVKGNEVTGQKIHKKGTCRKKNAVLSA